MQFTFKLSPIKRYKCVCLFVCVCLCVGIGVGVGVACASMGVCVCLAVTLKSGKASLISHVVDSKSCQ